MSASTFEFNDPQGCIFGMKACKCQRHKAKPVRPLTELILDCWLRECDKRPYQNLVLHGNVYRRRMYRHMTVRDLEVVVTFLQSKNHVKSLEIAYMDIPERLVLWQKLAKVANKLEKISFIAANIPQKLLEFMSVFAESSRIRVMRLSGSELTMTHAKHLRCFVLHSDNLQYLDVGYCGLDESTFAMVADGISKSRSLKAVDMSRIVNRSPVSYVDENKLGTLMAMILWTCPLVEIHLKKCGLDTESIQPLLEYVARSETLLYLDLGSNKLEGRGVSEILTAIKGKNCMIGLDVSNNRLGENGGEAIGHQLPETRLRYLDISRNNIPAEQMNLILSTIKKVFQTRILNIIGNEYDTKLAATLHRQTYANIFILEALDAKVTYDLDRKQLRVVSCENMMSMYNERYFRHANTDLWPHCFFIQNDVKDNLEWKKLDKTKKVLVNGMFVGPFIIARNGRVVGIDDAVDDEMGL
ncbi:unnamed protein product [Hermetia illucens]|uniref:Uncharacterized protein n=1 Tax=Hermetia illucens TaxID=343691 RepID=A0A7R8UTR7_HERIL|nr:unnamed protein product [Hermetia illucens]